MGSVIVNSLPRPSPLLCAVDAAALHLDERFDEREADAETSLCAIERSRRLHKQLEHVRQHVGRDSDAVVANRDRRLRRLDVPCAAR